MNQLEPGTAVICSPQVVEFRLNHPWGVKIWRVLLTSREPKFLAWMETPGDHGIENTPMAVSLSEIEFYVRYAREELKV